MGCDPGLTIEKFDDLIEEAEPKWTCIMCDGRRRERFVAALDRKLEVAHIDGKLIMLPALSLRD